MNIFKRGQWGGRRGKGGQEFTCCASSTTALELSVVYSMVQQNYNSNV